MNHPAMQRIAIAALSLLSNCGRAGEPGATRGVEEVVELPPSLARLLDASEVAFDAPSLADLFEPPFVTRLPEEGVELRSVRLRAAVAERLLPASEGWAHVAATLAFRSFGSAITCELHDGRADAPIGAGRLASSGLTTTVIVGVLPAASYGRHSARAISWYVVLEAGARSWQVRAIGSLGPKAAASPAALGQVDVWCQAGEWTAAGLESGFDGTAVFSWNGEGTAESGADDWSLRHSHGTLIEPGRTAAQRSLWGVPLEKWPEPVLVVAFTIQPGR